MDFFLNERISEGELEELQSDEFYPPRFQVFFASPQTQSMALSGGKIAFKGATSPIEFDIHLNLPPTPDPTTTSATNPLSGIYSEKSRVYQPSIIRFLSQYSTGCQDSD